MKYFVFKILPNVINKLELIKTFESFKDAKNFAREMRVQNSPDNPEMFKIVFAENELEAELMLSEKREKPILKEWEK